VTFAKESASGWQTAFFAHPVRISKDTTYVASYTAPAGMYSATNRGFSEPYRRGDLTVPSGGGVYTYGGGFPTSRYLDSNYYVDIVFQPGPAEPLPQASTPSGAPRPPELSPGPGNALSLPLVPWEGGSAYWKNFPKAERAGWGSPAFFPVAVWFNGVSSDEEVKYDKKLGINTYIGMWEGTPYRLFADNGVFWVGGKLNDSFTSASRNWVGDFLDDEVDGRFTPEEGRRHLQALLDPLRNDGRFKYANFTQQVMSTVMQATDAEKYVNDFTDAVSVDMYWYTIPYCSLRPYRDTYLEPVTQANCRTASSYGKTMRSLRQRDSRDGHLQALWQFVENLNGGPGSGPFVNNVGVGQLKGAVMSSLINGARGIVYFNQSLSGPCMGSTVFRQAQTTKNFCGAPQVAAAGVVNRQIKRLAPILNSQSYQYSFGPGLDTMLKADARSIYVFAMVDGSSRPGLRSFTLPPGVRGSSIEVMFENRRLKADPSGRFTDRFAAEYSYHVYKVSR
jgi:hypothetical protein